MEGSITDFTFQSTDGEYCVARLSLEGEAKAITIVGPLTGVEAGERVRVRGRWTEHPRYGPQFTVESFVPVLPATLDALEHYLGHKLVKGIGPKIAARIVKHFGEDTLNVLNTDPQRLLEVRGLKKDKAEELAEAWGRHRAVHDVMVFLQGVGLAPRLSARLFKQYGDKTVQILRTSPYRVAREVRQVGFKTADRIAEKMGIPHDAPERAEAGVLHVLAEALSDGHTYLPLPELVKTSGAMMELEAGPVEAAAKRLLGSGALSACALPMVDEAIFLPSMLACESAVAQYVQGLIETGKPFSGKSLDGALEAYESAQDLSLAEEQREAVLKACKGGVMVVTGGPGTGKTTLVRAVLAMLADQGLKILLCAPTGRAAQRLSETTGRRAATIHRMLKYTPDQGFLHTPKNPLSADLVIVDETSMVDIPLAYHLLRAIPPTASVLLVGDVDQLPSVGPGNFLRDLIESGSVPVVRLMKIFRQSQRSLIVTNAHRINHGEMPALPRNESGSPDSDFFYVENEDPEECLSAVKRLVHERIPLRFKFDAIRDVQVLTPMHRGVLGVQNLNRELQALLNPGEGGLARGGNLFRVGDKVMQRVNNYDLDVFNGDVGILTSFDREAGELTVRYGFRLVTYKVDDLEQLMPAYACTIHKSQGSEYKAVVIVLHTQHYIMLQRNLLYTAVTRGKKLVCVVGNRRALGMAVRNAAMQRRYSALATWLRSGVPVLAGLPTLSDDELIRMETESGAD